MKTILRDAYAALVRPDGIEVSTRVSCRIMLETDDGSIGTERTIRLGATQGGGVVVRFFTTSTLTNGDHIADSDESFIVAAGNFLDYKMTFDEA